MAATNPLFTVTFDVESGNYGAFIAEIRRLLSRGHFCRNRPVLPPEEAGAPPRLWFHIVLRTQQAPAGLTLATRADNLYLEGFRSQDGTWWELTQGYVPGATDLRFRGSTYPLLLGNADRLTELELGRRQMADAVNALAMRSGADPPMGSRSEQTKNALVVLLLMVHEAARLLTVSGFVTDLMNHRATSTITAEMKKQVNTWTDLSEAMLKADARPPGRNTQPGRFTPFTDIGVNTMEQAVAMVGILKFKEVDGGMTAAMALRRFHGH